MMKTFFLNLVKSLCFFMLSLLMSLHITMVNTIAKNPHTHYVA